MSGDAVYYFGVDLDLVWDAVEEELPKLKSTVTRLLAERSG
jgi:uncharacterized protein with HEPN domain